MWHEARKQERMIRGMIVDYRRRAERRKDFYEKIKAEPTQFLQLHGRPCRIHLDPAIAAAGEGPAIMMQWQGDPSNLIDRFDVRAHLDYIQEVKNPDVAPEELSPEERQCNYERYRILAQNVFLGIGEDKFLQQLAIEEQFGVTIEEKEMQKEKLNEKKGTGAAIGYNYNDPGAQPSCSNGPEVKKVEQKDSDDDSDLEIIDVDLSIDVNKMEASQAHELNAVGPQFGMAGCDLFSFLTGDADDAEHHKQLLREEKEKAMFSGRKSRRERRAHRDKKLAVRASSPPHYARVGGAGAGAGAGAAAAASGAPGRGSRSASSASPEPPGDVQFITSFGGDDDDPHAETPPKPLYADKLKNNLKKEMLYSEVARKSKPRLSPYEERPQIRPQMGPHFPPRPRSRSRSSSRSRSRSFSRRRSRSYSRSRSASRSRSRSYSPYRSRSRSGTRNYRDKRSRSPDNQASGYGKHNYSRSMSFDSGERSEQRPPVTRYYGRKKEDKSSSELSESESSGSPDDDKNRSDRVGNKSNSNQNQLRFSGSSSKGASRDTLSIKEKLKRKMQAQLTRQLRRDQREAAARSAREARTRATRDRDMRQLAIKLRRKQREMRHQQNRRSSDELSDHSRSGSSSRDSPQTEKKREDRSRSKSPSPEKRIPVWENNKEFATVPYRPKQETSENAYQKPKRRDYRPYQESNDYRDERKEDERQNYPTRFDRYPSREYAGRQEESYSRQDYTDRWEQDRSYSAGRRRPFGHRGGYRGENRGEFRGEHRGENRGEFRGEYRGDRHHAGYGDGPSSSFRNDDYVDNEDGYQKKVKLVDY